MLRVVVGENVNFSSFAEGVMASQGVQVHLLQVMDIFNLDTANLIIDHPLGVIVRQVIADKFIKQFEINKTNP